MLGLLHFLNWTTKHFDHICYNSLIGDFKFMSAASSPKYRKNSYLIKFYNLYSRSVYITKNFKSLFDKLFFFWPLISIFVGLSLAIYQQVNNSETGISTYWKWLALIVGIWGAIRNIIKWTRTEEGGAKPELKYEISNAPFLVSSIDQSVKLNSFPQKKASVKDYLYITVENEGKKNCLAFNTSIAKYWTSGKKIEFDHEYFDKNHSHSEQRVIDFNKTIWLRLRLALEIESRRCSSAGKNFFNAEKVRLNSFVARDGQMVAECSITSYFTRCSVPTFDGSKMASQWRDSLWDKFYTGAPRQLRQSVDQYKIVKRA